MTGSSSWKAFRDHSRGRGLPLFLTRSEVNLLLDAALTYERHILLSTLWHSGVRISEALNLRVRDFKVKNSLIVPMFLTVPEQSPKAATEWKRRGAQKRTIPIYSTRYIVDFNRYKRSYCLRNPARLWSINRQTAARWLVDSVTIVAEEHPDAWAGLSISLDTLRHSFAINALFQGMTLEQLSYYLGYRSTESTKHYREILALRQTTILNDIHFA